jgi:hypothetical protein
MNNAGRSPSFVAPGIDRLEGRLRVPTTSMRNWMRRTVTLSLEP